MLRLSKGHLEELEVTLAQIDAIGTLLCMVSSENDADIPRTLRSLGGWLVALAEQGQEVLDEIPGQEGK